MTNYWNDSNTITITTSSVTSGYTVMYTDMMTAAGIYTPYTEDTYKFLTDAQKNANKLVETTTAFDVDVYYSKWTNGYIEYMDRTNYNRTVVEGLRCEPFYVIPGSQEKTLKDILSYAIYGCSEIVICMSWAAISEDEKDAYIKSRGEGYDAPQFNKEHKDEVGDEVYIYLTVEDIYKNMVPVCVHLIRGKNEENEDADDSTGDEGLIIPGLFDNNDDNGENTYNISIGLSEPSAAEYIHINSISGTRISNLMEPIVHLNEVETEDDYSPLPDSTYIYATRSDADIATRKKKGSTELEQTSVPNARIMVENHGVITHSTIDIPETISWTAHTAFLTVSANPLCPIPYTLTITTQNESTGKVKYYTYNYNPSSTNISGINYKRAIKMNAPDVSYALLRTNPKLTGNIKVVVDSSSNIYLDTFKISDVMSKKRYRHIKTGADTYYGKGISSQFKDIPTTELYKVPDSCYTMFTTTQTYKGQYYDTYQYGVHTNDDEMYSENFSILAPLCVKRVMPDFFLVFKIDRSRADFSETLFTDQDKIQYFMRYGELVKSFDMRNGSELGNYIRKIYEMSKDYPGDMYESYDVNNSNRYVGISLDRGVVTAMHESVYPQEDTKNQVALNEYITRGFERNHIVSKDIINFEFLFNDMEDPMFSVNTYFGIYVRLNAQDNDFSCIGYNKDASVYEYDGTVMSFDSSTDLRTTSKFATLIYGVSTPTEFKRLNIGLPYSDVNKDFMLKPYKNIFSSPVKKLKKEDIKSFITMSLNKPLDVGDHIRVMVPTTKTIYEVIMSDLDLLDNLEGDYLDEYNLTDCITNYFNEIAAGYTIKRVGMHIHSRDTINRDKEYFNEYYTENKMYPENYYTEDDVVNNEIRSLFHAFKKFDLDAITSWKYMDNTLSIVSYVGDAHFERICSASGFTQTQYDYLRETSDEDDTLTFFGYYAAPKLILNIDSTNWRSHWAKYLYPMHFELVGSRMAYTMKFVNMSEIGDDENIYSVSINDKKSFDPKTILYFTKEDNEQVVRMLDTIYLSSNMSNVNDDIYTVKKTTKYIQSFDDFDRCIIDVSRPIIKNNSISLYNSYPINSGICSIFQMKDFDFNVLDSTRKILCATGASTIQKDAVAGEYAVASVFNNTPKPDDIGDEFIRSQFTMAFMNESDFAYEISRMMVDASLNGEAEDFSGKSLTFDEFKENTYTLCPLIKGTYIVDKDNSVLGLDMVYDHYDAGTNTYKWKHKQEGEGAEKKDVHETLIADDSTCINYFDTGYSSKPLRSSDEEDFRNYIDLSAHYDSSAYDSSWWDDISSEAGQQCFSELYNKNHKFFDVSLVSPYCCKWTGIGSDARCENMRIMKDYEDCLEGSTSYYAVGPNSYDTYIGYLYTPDKVSADLGTVKKYIPKTLNDPYIIERKDSTGYSGHIYAKDYILDHLGALDDLLYNELDNNNKFTVAYLSGQNTLEFISAGVKLRIRSNNDNALDLSKYNGYSAIFVSLPSVNKAYGKQTELIIDEQRHEIMFIWYQPVDTLKLGQKVRENDVDSLMGGFAMRLPFSGTFSDVKPAFQVDENKSYKAMTLPDEHLYGAIDQPYGLDVESIVKDKETKSRHKGTRLCKNTAYIFLSTRCYSENSYTKPMSMGISGLIHDQSPKVECIETTYPYYENEGKITTTVPVVWGTYENNFISTTAVERGLIDVEEGIEGWIVTDNINYIIPAIGSYEDLKTAIKSCSIFIKTDNGKKDLSRLNNILSISVVDPMTYYKYPNTNSNIKGNNRYELGQVHSTYAQPLMKDVFKFNYFSSRILSSATLNYTSEGLGDVEEIFQTSFDGANISIKDINPLSQVWFNKYTTDPNYCLQSLDDEESEKKINSYKLSVDFINDVNIMEDSWAHDTYRRYYVASNMEKYDNVKGYETGYELKRYFSSRGVVLHGCDGNTVEITSWKDSEINTADGYIKLNISDSIVYNVLFRPAFDNAWTYLDLKNNDAKINYIKNTILNFININNKTKFVLRKSVAPTKFISFNTDYVDDETKTTELFNYRNLLKYENGKYYMYIYPEEKYMYYAKMIITL